MTELICECGEKASGPDAESVTEAMSRHLDASGHSLVQAALPEAEDEPESAPTEGS